MRSSLSRRSGIAPSVVGFPPCSMKTYRFSKTTCCIRACPLLSFSECILILLFHYEWLLREHAFIIVSNVLFHCFQWFQISRGIRVTSVSHLLQKLLPKSIINCMSPLVEYLLSILIWVEVQWKNSVLLRTLCISRGTWRQGDPLRCLVSAYSAPLGQLKSFHLVNITRFWFKQDKGMMSYREVCHAGSVTRDFCTQYWNYDI